MENLELIYLTCNSLSLFKGEDIVVVDTTQMANTADYFIFATATSSTQANAIANYVTEELEKHDIKLLGREGFGMAEWIALDFDMFFVHIFTKDLREKYNIEKFINDGKNLKKFETIQKEVLAIQKKVKKQEKLNAKKSEKEKSKVTKVKKERVLKPKKQKDKSKEKVKVEKPKKEKVKKIKTKQN